MSNKNNTEFHHTVYDRKILRNMLKRQLKTNKIRDAWKYVQSERRKKYERAV